MAKSLTMTQAGVLIGISRQAIYKRQESGLLPHGCTPIEAVMLEIKRLRQEADAIEKRLNTFLEGQELIHVALTKQDGRGHATDETFESARQ